MNDKNYNTETITQDELKERDRLLYLQRQSNRWFSQEEFERLQFLSAKMLRTPDKVFREIRDRLNERVVDVDKNGGWDEFFAQPGFAENFKELLDRTVWNSNVPEEHQKQLYVDILQLVIIGSDEVTKVKQLLNDFMDESEDDE